MSYKRTPSQRETDRLYRRARRAAGLEPPRTEATKARQRRHTKIRYWALRRVAIGPRPRYWHPRHRCTSCDRTGHNARTCARREA